MFVLTDPRLIPPSEWVQGYRFMFDYLGLTWSGHFYSALDWCDEQFGDRYGVFNRSVMLKDDNDAFQFRLRWC